MDIKDMPEEITSLVQYGEGETVTEKIKGLVIDSLCKKLRECEEEIYQYEIKYGMDFDEFKRAWEEDKIPRRYSHQIERDFMVWEGLEAERRKWLSKIKELLHNNKIAL
ncbi:hypothetical protein J7K19_13120 [bacterium]|nr:hypothetical protein [bacterium]